jgi:predicted dehydrogenase
MPAIQAGVITEAGGAHLSNYFSSLAQTEEIASVALCDPSGESESLARKTLGAKLTAVYKDAREMLRREKPKLALVTMEAVHSPPAIDAALDAGCHVLSEKPGCVRLEDFERLNSKAVGRGLHLILALANRSDPVFINARRMIAEGKIGKIYGLEVHIIADQTRLTKAAYHTTWQAQKARAGGGQLIYEGIHWLDLSMFLTGAPLESVTGFTADVGGQPLDVEDSAVVAMRLRNGALGSLTSGYYLDKGYHSHLKVWGSHGWLDVEKHTEAPLEWYSTLDAEPRIHRPVEPAKPSGSVYPLFVRAVARACAGDGPMPLSRDDSVMALRSVFACYRAAATGQRQRIA